MKNGIGLDRKFTHRALYKDSELTVRDFLELAAESRSFYISERKEFKSENLLDDPETFYVLICEEGYSIRLTDEEAVCFSARRLFWRKWQEEFVKKYFKGSCNDEYIRLENEKKREVPEYLQAISRAKTR